MSASDLGSRFSSFSLHATAVACGRTGIVIVGPSRAGKSRLAMGLISAKHCSQPVALIGDDRVEIRRGLDRWMVRGHPRIAGFAERRGLGLVTVPFAAEATLAGVVVLPPAAQRQSATPRLLDASKGSRRAKGATSRAQRAQNLSCLSLVTMFNDDERLRRVAVWLDKLVRRAEEQVERRSRLDDAETLKQRLLSLMV